MARVKVRYFVEKPGKDGSRLFWQPSKILRGMGWQAQRLPDDKTMAIARAEDLNRQLDAWRKGEAPAEAAAGETARPKATPPQAPQIGTVSDLIRRYKKSHFYLGLADKTRYEYKNNLNVIEEWAGRHPVASIGPARVQALYEALYERTPSKAAAVIGMLRILLKHGIRCELIKTNSAEDPGIKARPFVGKLWPTDAISLFVETADRLKWPSVGTAVAINHWIGQRQADILELERSSYRGGVFYVRQNKTDARIAVPHSPWVGTRIEAELKRQAERKIESAKHLLLCETTGQPWKGDHFRHIFAEIRAAAAAEWSTFYLEDESEVGMDELWFMHLRHTAVTELAIAGCTIPEIAAITGHTIKSVYSILERYLVTNSALAKVAMQKRLQMDTEIVALMDGTSKDQ